MTAPADGFANWQPIETAPKDGTRILVFRPGKGGHENSYQSVYWRSDHQSFGACGWSYPHWNGPTHWQPLPPPPTSTPPGERAESK